MSNSDRENWTIDDWRNYAHELENYVQELEKNLKHTPKKSGAPRKHPKELVGAVIYRIVEAKLEGNKLTAKEALADELEKRGIGRWRAQKEYRPVLNEVSKRKGLRSIIEAVIIQQRAKQIELKLMEERIKLMKERIKFIEDASGRHDARQIGLADAIDPEFIRAKES